MSAVEYDYGPRHNQIVAERARDYDGQVVRVRRTEYLDDPMLRDKHIFNLPKVTELYGGGTWAASRFRNARTGRA